MDPFFTNSGGGALNAPQQPTRAPFPSISGFEGSLDLDFGKKKKKGKGKHKKKSKQKQREAQVARLAYAYGAAAYENLMLRRMMALALAAQRGKLHEAPIEVGFEVLDGKKI